MVPSVVTIAGVPDILNRPQAVCTDSIGNIFIADTYNQRVRKIDKYGKISTLAIPVTFSADSTYRAPNGMTIDNNDILYVTDTWEDRILVVNSNTAEIIRLITSTDLTKIRRPYNVWLVGSQLYIANLRGGGGGLGTISVYNISTREFSSTVLTFNFPITVAVGPDGSVYSIEEINSYSGADYTPNRHCVRRYKNGVYSTFAGVPNSAGSSGDGGPATAAELNSPSSVFTDAFGNVYICDTGNGRIRMVSPDGIIQTVLGGGSTYNEGGHPLQIQTNPVSIWFDAQGRMYFTETNVRRINSVYKPSWWDAVRYEKICKPCNAIVRPPPLPPVPTVLRLVNPTTTGSYGNQTVVPSNGFIHVYFQPRLPSDYGAGMRYLYLRTPNFDGSSVNLQTATIGDRSLVFVAIFGDDIRIDTESLILDANTVLVLNFESQINDILEVFYANN
jgi:sugar lactone lactonase YvrE